MTRDDYAVCGKIEAPVTTMVGGITEEDTRGRSRGKFVWSGSGEVRMTPTAKDTKMIKGMGRPEENFMGSFGSKSFSGMEIENVGGGVKSFTQ